MDVSPLLANLLVALGIGLLIGAERERRKIEKARPTLGGIRTFALAALAGALAVSVGGVALLAVLTLAAAGMAGLSYWRTREDGDPGLTTEIALVLTVLVGALAMSEPGVAAATGVAVAVLLAARRGVHRFVGEVLTEEEVRAALILGAAAVVILPLLPNRPMGPLEALNPQSIWRLVVLVLAIGAAGHVAVRALGARFGLPLAGLASGFVSSAATIGAMGAHAAKAPEMLRPAVAGAVLSTVATVIQMAIVVAVLSPAVLRELAVPLSAAGIAAVVYGAVFTVKALRKSAEDAPRHGNPFSLVAALVFAATLSVVLLGSAALRHWFGQAGAIVGAALAGFVDAHAAAISMASLAATGKLAPAAAVIPILAGLTTNTVTKVVFAAMAGGRAFAVRVIPGLLLVAAAAWAGAFVVLAAG